MEKTNATFRSSTSNSLVSSLSLSSLVAATEGDHQRLMVKLPGTEQISTIEQEISTMATILTDFSKKSNCDRPAYTTSVTSTPENLIANDDSNPATFDTPHNFSQSVDLEEFMDIISIICR